MRSSAVRVPAPCLDTRGVLRKSAPHLELAQQVVSINKRISELEEKISAIKAKSAAPLEERTQAHCITDGNDSGVKDCDNADIGNKPKHYIGIILYDILRQGRAKTKGAHEDLNRISYSGPPHRVEAEIELKSNSPRSSLWCTDRVQKVTAVARKVRTKQVKMLRVEHWEVLPQQRRRNQMFCNSLSSRERAKRKSRDLDIARETSYDLKSGYKDANACRRYIARLEKRASSRIGPQYQAKIPDQNGHVLAVTFPCMSSRIEDPLRWRSNHSFALPWTVSEKKAFIELFLMRGKDFEAIAKNLNYRTTHECVQFYYDKKIKFKLKRMAQLNKKKRITPSHVVKSAWLPDHPRSIAHNFTYLRPGQDCASH